MGKKQFYEGDYFELLKCIFENSYVGYIIADKNGDFIMTNKAHEKITGYSEEMIKELNFKYIEEEATINNISSTKLVLEELKEIQINEHLANQNKNILVKGIPFFDNNKEIKYVISEVFDTKKLQEIHRKVSIENKKNKNEHYEEVVTNESFLEEEKDFIVYKSKKMSNIMETARLAANTNATVLILGESGTGKELLAKYIHKKSTRKNKKFVKINCSALPENLLESELFGYEPGSFTGGISEGKKGLLEYADKGTILLDEIGDMALSLQAKILRFLQEKEIMKIGGKTPIKLDVRVIASTNVDLIKLINEDKFRDDLYYRLNVVPIKLPSLEERKEDIPLLIHYFIKYFNFKYNRNKSLDKDLLSIILDKTFNGNIRQLSNLIERLIIMSQKDVITIKDFEGLNYDESKLNKYNKYNQFIDETKTFEEMKNDFEKQLLKYYKDRFKTTIKISEKLDVDQSTISRKLNRYGIK